MRRHTGIVTAVVLAAMAGLYSCTSFSSGLSHKSPLDDGDVIPLINSPDFQKKVKDKVPKLRWANGRLRVGEPKYLFETIDDYLGAVDETWMEKKEVLYDRFVADMNVNPFKCNNGDNQYAFLESGEVRNLLRLDGTSVRVYGSLNDDCEQSDMSGELDDLYAQDLVYNNYMYDLARRFGVEIQTPDGVQKLSLVDLVKNSDYEMPSYFLDRFDADHKSQGLLLLEEWRKEGVSPKLQETFDCMLQVYQDEMSDDGYNLRTCIPF